LGHRTSLCRGDGRITASDRSFLTITLFNRTWHTITAGSWRRSAYVDVRALSGAVEAQVAISSSGFSVEADSKETIQAPGAQRASAGRLVRLLRVEASCLWTTECGYLGGLWGPSSLVDPGHILRTDHRGSPSR